MATVRVQREVSPIPPGRYWVVLLGELSQREFVEWIRDMQGAARVEAVSLDQRPALSATRQPSAEFVIFTVPEGRFPFWPAARFGFPNVAPPEVTSVQDIEATPRGLGPFGFDPDSLMFFPEDQRTRGEGSFIPGGGAGGFFEGLGNIGALGLVALALAFASSSK